MLKNKNCLITGAARGLGRAMAELFAENGAHIIALDACERLTFNQDAPPSHIDDLKKTGEIVKGVGQRCYLVKANLVDYQDLYSVYGEIKSNFEKLDVICCNAGIQSFKPLLECSSDEWMEQIINNVQGTFNTIRMFAPMLSDNASIIITSSTQGIIGTQNGSAYSASKHALIGLAKSFAIEVAKKGWRVNVIIPGLIDTSLTRNPHRIKEIGVQLGAEDPSKLTEKQAFNLRAKHQVMGQAVQNPKDVAQMALFLASDASKLCTGGIFPITSGDDCGF